MHTMTNIYLLCGIAIITAIIAPQLLTVLVQELKQVNIMKT